MYELKVEDVIPLERMAQKSAENLVNGIEKSKEIPFERVLLFKMIFLIIIYVSVGLGCLLM